MKISKTILIPNYNGADFIKDTVNCFKTAFPDDEIVVVDDASTDLSIAELSSLDITLLKREKNGGFAAAVNTGLHHLQSQKTDFVIVSNSDINMTPEAARKIDDYIANLESDNRNSVLGFLEEGDAHADRRTGDKVSGFFFGLGQAIIRKVGYLDEGYFMYGEEQDYFRRVLRAGFPIIQTGIQVHHVGEKSGTGRLRNSWLAMRNALRLELKFLSVLRAMKTFGILFLIINRLHKPESDVSLERILRPGIVKGNVMLALAVVWNIVMLPITLRSRLNEH